MKKAILTLAGGLLFFTYAPKMTFAAPSSAPAQQDTTKENTKVFSGTILRSGDNYVLSDTANKLAYLLDNPEKAGPYEGKKVKVTGTVDAANNTIHIETIQELA
jgi:hypothetical protein